MMKARSFVLNGTITARRIKQLITRIELCKAKNVTIYLSSNGGYVGMSDILIDFTKRSNKKLHFIGSEIMASACIHIFIEAKGKKSILPYTSAMLHMTSVEHESRDIRNKHSLVSVLVESGKIQDEERLKRYVQIFNLTEAEESILKNGLDLGIGHERLKKALPKINKIK